MTTARRSSLGLLLLGMLTQEPMHAYRMQKLLLQTGKDRVVNIRQRASVYQAIERLSRMGLIQVRETVHSERHPDRTVYEITDLGRDTIGIWLGEALRATEEFPEFVAAVSLLSGLEPDVARGHLDARAAVIEAELADVERTLRDTTRDLTEPPGPVTEPRLARLFLLEEEYRQTVLTAQLTWLRGVITDLETGRLTWNHTELRDFAAQLEEYHNDDV